jgi:hypothetical protein
LGKARPAEPACGIEHEFQVHDAAGVVDFRTLIHTLPVPGRRIDPADPNAYRCHWGGALTADGREAEVATPPIPLRAGFTKEVVRSTADGRRCLNDLLPIEHQVTGYSTHINVSVLDSSSLHTARRCASRFAVAIMLLLDRADSPGLLIRPRPGRLEIGGEYCDGDALHAAVLMVTGAVLCCSTKRFGRRLPPPVLVDLVPAVERFGFYVDRKAFGEDLYVAGRACQLQARGGKRTAQRQLEDCWRAARSRVRPYATHEDLALVDDLVAGLRTLPMERAEPAPARP